MLIASLLIELGDAALVRETLRRRMSGKPNDPQERKALALLESSPGQINALLGLLEQDRALAARPWETLPAGLAATRSLFDAAAEQSPEAAVAFYTLGDPACLAAATDELVCWLAAADLLGPMRDVLDFGCGIGRVAEALAGRVRNVFGLDLSPRMICLARERCAGLDNLRFAVSAGDGLAPVGDARFDLVLAIDSLPYLYRAGGFDFVSRTAEAIAERLRPGGDLLVANLSYRGDLALDRREAALLAARLGLQTLRDGDAPLRHWDGRIFHFKKPG